MRAQYFVAFQVKKNKSLETVGITVFSRLFLSMFYKKDVIGKPLHINGFKLCSYHF